MKSKSNVTNNYMNLRRTLYCALTYPQRLRHRWGFGVQSPWAYELVRDVFFEELSYYAYEEQGLKTKSDRQLWRIRNRFRNSLVVLSDTACAEYDKVADAAAPDTMLVVEKLNGINASLWEHVLNDPRATVTFDLGKRGVISFDPKRIKQNYIL